MDEQQHRAVQKHRDRIEKCRSEVDEQRRGGDAGAAQKSEARLADAQSEYALYRLREGLGPDPVFIEDSTLHKTLKDLVARSKISALVEEGIPTRIGDAARQAMLLSNYSLAGGFESAPNQQPKLLSLLSERSPIKENLRRWSVQIHDPYVKETLEQLRRLEQNFDNTRILLQKRIDKLRRRYEDELPELEHMELDRVENQTLLRVSHVWSDLAAEFPEDAREVYGIFRALELQLEEIQSIKELLNAELRKFVANLIPAYLALIEMQSRSVRRAVLGSFSPSAKLAEKLMREARQADYLLPGEGLPVPHPRLPREFSALRKLSAYQTFKETNRIERVQNAETVEFPTNR
ncbi:MAG: hypothetical protein HYU36_17560 [Planctomycetes bacterium]|nr:hypothetical protein [Planctomycetota bacterium]